MTRDKLSGVYIITNTVNGNRYIGSSVDIHRRWWQHRSQLCKGTHGNQILQRAWDKYGESSFEFSILLLCSETDTLLNEQQCLDTFHPEYNICISVTASMLGRTMSEEHKRKIGDANKGRVMSDEQKLKLSEAHKGKKWSEEHRANMEGKHAHFGYKFTDEQKEHLRQSHLGYVMPEEQKNKIGEAGKGRIVSAETREKIGKIHAGKINSEETRQKISATLLSRPYTYQFTDEHKEKLRLAWIRRRNGSKSE